jgi:hypothetical protein
MKAAPNFPVCACHGDQADEKDQAGRGKTSGRKAGHRMDIDLLHREAAACLDSPLLPARRQVPNVCATSLAAR